MNARAVLASEIDMRRFALFVVIAACSSSPPPQRPAIGGHRFPLLPSSEREARLVAQAAQKPPECADTIQAIELFDEHSTDTEWKSRFRERALDHLCRHQWKLQTHTCLRDASTPQACNGVLDSRELGRLGRVATQAKRIESLRDVPDAITCERVAAHVHPEAIWKNLVDAEELASRVTTIRSEMAGACRKEGWSVSARACLMSDATEYTCLGRSRWSPWRVARRLPIECAELRNAMKAAKTCRTAPQALRDELDDWWMELAHQLRIDELKGDMVPDELPLVCDVYGFKARAKLVDAGCSE